MRYSNRGIARSVASFFVVVAHFFGAYAIHASPLSDSRTQSPTPPPAFDVASIKASDPDASAFAIRPNPNSFAAQGVTLKYLIQYAFDLHDFQIEGEKDWTNRKRFDVLVKMDPLGNDVSGKDGRTQKNADWTLAKARLRNLLIERFSLRFHQSLKRNQSTP